MPAKDFPLIAIVTGLEHSGTTYLSKLITCHPKIDCAFECGVLFANSPKEFINFQPFYNWMLGLIEAGHWGIKKKDMNQVCLAENWQEMYRKIIQYSPIFVDKSSYILDKTPGYMPKLDQILGKVPAPCLVIKKNILFQYISFKKRDFSLEEFKSHYIPYMNGLKRALDKFSDRIYIVEYEDLYCNTAKRMVDIFKFINLEIGKNCLEAANKNASLFKENIIVAPFSRDFKYDKEVEKVKQLTEIEIDTLETLQEKMSKI